jgi:hypothetical protein
MHGSIVGRDILIRMGLTQLVGTIDNYSAIHGTYSDGTWRIHRISDATDCSDAFFWDIDSNGIPEFVTSDHIELSKVNRISRFRSGVGHDFSDDFESCRSVKHYYAPFDGLDWSQIKIFSPIDGVITRIDLERYPNSGKRIYIMSRYYPAFVFRIFHVNVNQDLLLGNAVVAGQEIGTHISNITCDDIAVGVSTLGGLRLVSFFRLITDSLFQSYQARGILSRSEFIISEEARNDDPLNCSGETFGTFGTIENWVNLQ